MFRLSVECGSEVPQPAREPFPIVAQPLTQDRWMLELYGFQQLFDLGISADEIRTTRRTTFPLEVTETFEGREIFSAGDGYRETEEQVVLLSSLFLCRELQ